MLQLEKLEQYCKVRNIKATFVDGILIEPLPVIKSNYRVRKELYFLEIAINRYGCKTVVDAMFNKQMTLIL
ncbi:hypothetical protein UFOVP622_7 [uncultured Caudovirales phage]|uniref:Uncharacterized protein n=1 Tax=uncultured Caudovirales phage TaxID=2100421 RepID=A0A6J5N7I3_9CAUD|nr:hypothetical protein UFOVP622_7 [uncultured Caudovirales phage]